MWPSISIHYIHYVWVALTLQWLESSPPELFSYALAAQMTQNQSRVVQVEDLAEGTLTMGRGRSLDL